VPLEITTEGGAPIVSRDDYVNGSMVLDGVTHPLRIRGRGNSTWAWPKKPYKLKLDDDASLLGMPADDEWVLLANYADRTSLRTQLAFALASRLRLGWVPRVRFVDVVLNGEALGLYVLTEQVEQGENRVWMPTGGNLVEIDHRFRAAGEPGFWTYRRTPVSFKDPDELTLDERRVVRRAFNGFEKVLYGKAFADPAKGYASLIDVPSVIDWYLLEEFFLNQDSNFFSSVNVTWAPDSGFAMGPPWDFDLSAGNHWITSTPPAAYYYTRYGREHWINRMFDNPAFAAAVKRRWARIRPTVDQMLAEIPAAATAIRPSAIANLLLWPPSDIPALGGSTHADTFNGEVDYLRDWLSARADWMSADEAVFGKAPWSVDEVSRVVRVPVRILGTQKRPVQVSYRWSSTTATRGEDFKVRKGTLVFGPGESVKTFPVTILGDKRPEGAETITFKLVATATGPRLGDPSVVTLTIRPSDRS
jgi:hypothetical protein